MKVFKYKVDASEYSQIMENGKTELILPILEENQDKYVTITPKEVTMALYDKVEISFTANGVTKTAEIVVEGVELDYSPDEEGFIQLYEGEKGKLHIQDANIVFILGDRKVI